MRTAPATAAQEPEQECGSSRSAASGTRAVSAARQRFGARDAEALPAPPTGAADRAVRRRSMVPYDVRSPVIQRAKRRQHAAQVLARPVQSRFHGADLGIDGAGNLFERQLFVLEQEERLSLERRQRLNGLRHQLRGLPRRGVDRRGGKAFLVERIPALLGPPLLPRQVACDGEQEWPHGRPRRVVSVGMPQQRQEAFLHDVLGGSRRTGHAPSKAVDHIFVVSIGGANLRLGHGLLRSHSMVTRYREKDTVRRATHSGRALPWPDREYLPEKASCALL